MSSINIFYRLIFLIVGTIIASNCQGEEFIFNIKSVNSNNRIIYKPYINGKKCLFMLDTGFFVEAIVKKFADENNINYFELDDDFPEYLSKIGIKYCSDMVSISLDGFTKFNDRFMVIDLPHFGIDGIFSWRVARGFVIKFNWDAMTVTLTNDPSFDKDGYKEFDIVEYRGILRFQINEPVMDKNIVVIDTGDPGGISLSHKLWSFHYNEICKAERNLNGSYSVSSGYFICDSYLIDRIDVSGLEWGPLTVEKNNQDVPEETIIGLQALSSFDVIVDGPKNKIYFKKRKRAGILPYFDRSGFVFLPKSSDSKYLTATVILDSPGYKAGLRDGDELLEFNGKDFTDWKNHLNYIGESKINKKPLEMKVRRGELILLVTVKDY